MKSPYKPIDCSYYDRLEAWATLGEICHIIWLDKEGTKCQVDSKINDLRLEDGVEYLIIADHHLSIRLDQLISVNGIYLPGSNCTI